MKAGDLVVLLRDPLGWGVGQVDHVRRSDGLLWVEWEDAPGGVFSPHELELAVRWEAGHGQSLTVDTLDRLRQAA